MSIVKAFSNNEGTTVSGNDGEDDSTDFCIVSPVLENAGKRNSTLNVVKTDTILGLNDFQNVQNAVNSIDNKRGDDRKYTGEERYMIGKYASENGATSTARKYKKQFQKWNESTARSMKQKYEDELKRAVREKREIQKAIKQDKRGRPLMLGEELDTKILKYRAILRLYDHAVDKYHNFSEKRLYITKTSSEHHFIDV